MLKQYIKIENKILQTLKKEEGMATIEYAIVLVAAAGFAGLLIVLLKSDFVREKLEELISNAFSGTV